MNEVSGEILRFFRDLSGRVGISFDDLLAPLPDLDPRGKKQPARIGWDTYVGLWESFVRLDARPEAVEDSGRFAVQESLSRPLQVIAKGLTSTSAIYVAISDWFGPSLFRNLEFSHERLSDGNLRLV